MTFLEKWFEEVWNKRREGAIDEMALPEAKTYGLAHADGSQVSGREAFKDFHRQFCSSFTDIHVDVTHSISEGDLTMARCVVSGVHSGDGLGIPPTGRKVELSGMCLARIENEKLAEAWNNFDLEALYRQLQ